MSLPWNATCQYIDVRRNALQLANPFNNESFLPVSKIVLIGCRNIEPANGYSLLNRRISAEVVLVGDGAEDLRYEILNLDAAVPTGNASMLRVGSDADLTDADICVLASGVKPSGDATADESISLNITLVHRESELLRKHKFDGVLVVTTSPADVMALVAMETIGLAASKVIGLGTSADVDHDAPSSSTWCTAISSGAEYMDSCQPDCPHFEDVLKKTCYHSPTSYRPVIANCVLRICEAIVRDEKTVMPVAALLTGQHGIIGAFANIPCVIGRAGIEQIVEFPVSSDERSKLLDSARDNFRRYQRIINGSQKAKHAVTS
jgi:L-lactate dehydrogenase